MLPHPYPDWSGKHVYADNGTYTLTLIVGDARGGRDTATTTVTIANVAPTIIAGTLTAPATPILLADGSASAPIAFEFRDPAGNNDVYAAEIACGNGVVVTGTDIRVPYGFTGTYAGSCTYTSAGVYAARATVSDEDGGASAAAFFRYVVVFDPAGGSVTAGGFYDVPGQGDRKAHFTFSASFLSVHETTPNGSVKFWIPTRDLDFESTAIEMLVVSGNRAQFWGTGTLERRPRAVPRHGRGGAEGGPWRQRRRGPRRALGRERRARLRHPARRRAGRAGHAGDPGRQHPDPSPVSGRLTNARERAMEV